MRTSLLLLLAGCPVPKEESAGETAESAETADTRTCDDVLVDVVAELAVIQQCTTWEECGQPLVGTSCGCTRNLVARTDADLTTWEALLAEVQADQCDFGMSTCDCPIAYGYDCVDATCTWDYAQGDYLPDCQAERGLAYTLDAIAIAGDTLTATLEYSGGCGDHAFTLCWPDLSFLESDPVQASLEIFHEGEDKCEGWYTEEVTLDLAPLRQAWKAAYGAGSGTIVVNLGGYTADYTF